MSRPAENPHFSIAMDAFKQNQTAENEKALLTAIQNSTFLLPLKEKLKTIPNENGSLTVEKGNTISFLMLSTTNNQPSHFGFSSHNTLIKWSNAPDRPGIICSFKDITSMVLNSSNSIGFLINPSSDNFFLSRQKIAHMSGKGNPIVIQEETKVEIGLPANYPIFLVEELKKSFKGDRSIKKAWLLLMKRNEEESFLLILAHKGDQKKVVDFAGQAAHPHLPSGMYIDIVTTDEDFGKQAIQDYKPFYKRWFLG